MTIPVSHLPRCTKLHPSDRYACNCGADSQNERAAMLDRVEAAAHSHRVGDASPETAEPTPAADPLAPDPEDGTLCADCKAPRNTIHGALCSLRWGKSPGRVPGPAAPDASLEARRAFDAFKAWCEADDLPRDARWLAVVRAVDASRPTLTEEQARAWHPFTSGMASEALCAFCGKTAAEHVGPTMAAMSAVLSGLGWVQDDVGLWAEEGNGCHLWGTHDAFRSASRKIEALRASRGELGPTKPGAQ